MVLKQVGLLVLVWLLQLLQVLPMVSLVEWQEPRVVLLWLSFSLNCYLKAFEVEAMVSFHLVSFVLCFSFQVLPSFSYQLELSILPLSLSSQALILLQLFHQEDPISFTYFQS